MHLLAFRADVGQLSTVQYRAFSIFTTLVFQAQRQRINLREYADGGLGVAFDEAVTAAELVKLLSLFYSNATVVGWAALVALLCHFSCSSSASSPLETLFSTL